MTFKLWGISFEIRFMFAATVALLLCVDRFNVVVPSLLSVAVHECGHLLGMALCGIKPDRISLSGCGVIIDTHQWSSRCKGSIIALMGPAANLLPALILPRGTFKIAMLINGLFNLMPINGTDGGDVIGYAAEGMIPKVKWLFLTVNILFIAAVLTVGLLIFVKSFNPTLVTASVYFALIFVASEK